MSVLTYPLIGLVFVDIRVEVICYGWK